jgi:hypothetical protein
VSIAFVFDENLRGPPLAAVRRHNRSGLPPVDATEVGEPADLPRGTPDPTLLVWAETNGRIVVTLDRQTMPTHLADHLAAGRHSPGVILVRTGTGLRELVDELMTATHAGFPADYADQVTFIP